MNTSVLLASAIAIAVLMLGTWLVSLPLKNASIVDPIWPLGFVVVGLNKCTANSGKIGKPR